MFSLFADSGCSLFLSRDWFQDHGMPGKLRAIQTVSCLLQGPSEAGNQVLELNGIMENILALCASSQVAHQLVAVEALIHAADKAKRASFITANGVTLLKEIYKHSERDSIRIRALVVSRRSLFWIRLGDREGGNLFRCAPFSLLLVCLW